MSYEPIWDIPLSIPNPSGGVSCHLLIYKVALFCRVSLLVLYRDKVCLGFMTFFFFFLAQVHFYLSPQPEHSSVPWSCSSSPKGNVPQSLDVVQAERVCASITSGKLVSFMLSWVDPISLHWLFITISRYPGLHHFKPFGFNDWILPFPLSVHWL